MELPTETPFLVTTKFEKYGTYMKMENGILMIMKVIMESTTKEYMKLKRWMLSIKNNLH